MENIFETKGNILKKGGIAAIVVAGLLVIGKAMLVKTTDKEDFADDECENDEEGEE